MAHHLKPGQLFDEREKVSDGAIRRLARKCEPDLLYRVAKADCLGRRPGAFEPVAMEWFRERVRQLDVAVRPPEPLLKGRDVIALGVAPGPEVGRVLQAVYERQLDGEVTTPEEARAEACRILGFPAPRMHLSDGPRSLAEATSPPVRRPRRQRPRLSPARQSSIERRTTRGPQFRR